MYEILKQYETIGKRELPVQELRELLGIAKDEYTYWQNFKVRVLDSCQQALKETTDICFTYERGKAGQGGKWLSVIFYIKKNEDYIDQLTLDEFINMQPQPEPVDMTTGDELEGQMTILESQKQRLFLLGITEKYRKQDMSSFVISSQCNNCMAYQAKYKRKTATAK